MRSVPLTRNDAHFRTAKFCSRFGQRVEHRLEIDRRTANNFEHVGGRGLLLQRLVALPLCMRKLFFKVCIGVLRHRGRPCPPFGASPSMAVVAC